MSEYQTAFGTVGQPATPEQQRDRLLEAYGELLQRVQTAESELAAQTARAEAAERERDAIRADRDSHQRVGIRMMQERDALSARLDAVTAALDKYGQHMDDCAVTRGHFDEHGRLLSMRHCACGLLQAIAAASGSQEGQGE